MPLGFAGTLVHLFVFLGSFSHSVSFLSGKHGREWHLTTKPRNHRETRDEELLSMSSTFTRSFDKRIESPTRNARWMARDTRHNFYCNLHLRLSGEKR